MTYFLDFDRTIFDTPAFKKTVAKRPTVMELFDQSKEVIKELAGQTQTDSKRRIFAKTFGNFISHGRFAFMPDELRTFLYPDVPPFFAKNAKNCIIVTYGVRAFITAKVTTALSDFPLENIVYTARKKGRTIRRLCKGSEGPFTYVDDAHFQLESVQKYCPSIKIIEIRRDKRAGDGRWPVIHSLDELT
jgi:hypothetical protein